MIEKKVGRIKNVFLNEETMEMELTISITDPKFKKRLLRDLSLSGHLIMEDNNIIYLPAKEKKDAKI